MAPGLGLVRKWAAQAVSCSTPLSQPQGPHYSSRRALKAADKVLCLHTRLAAPRLSQPCINPSLKQPQQHREALTASGQGTQSHPGLFPEVNRIYWHSQLPLPPCHTSILPPQWTPISPLHACSQYFNIHYRIVHAHLFCAIAAALLSSSSKSLIFPSFSISSIFNAQ